MADVFGRAVGYCANHLAEVQCGITFTDLGHRQHSVEQLITGTQVRHNKEMFVVFIPLVQTNDVRVILARS